MYGDEAEARWLLTFNENIVEAKRTRGFLLVIQQCVLRDKSRIQTAEVEMASWRGLPLIGIHALPITHVRGGNVGAEKEVDDAIAAAKSQWANGVWKEVQTVGTVYERVDGKALFIDDETGQIQGFARCIYGNGDTYEGEFLHGMKHGRGTYRFATRLADSGPLLSPPVARISNFSSVPFGIEEAGRQCGIFHHFSIYNLQ